MSALTTFAETIFAFVLMLGVLVTVHEFGHFIVAKWCGVRVLKFSVGFGPAISIGRFRLAWTRGETEYVIAWFPLGGYVKMLGENPGEEDTPAARAEHSRTLGAQTLPKKLAIVLAGPAMNLLLPVFVLMGFLWVGVPQPLAVVGSVAPASPAARAGVLPGDRVVSVGGEAINDWRALADAIAAAPAVPDAQPLALELARGEEQLAVRVPVAKRAAVDAFGAATTRGFIGVQHERQRAHIVLHDVTGPAARAGLQTGDLLRAADGTALEDWSALARAYVRARAKGGALRLQVQRGANTHEVLLPARAPFHELGAAPAAVQVEAVNAGSPAARAGLLAGDLILEVNGAALSGFLRFQELVRASEGAALQLRLVRAGAVVAASVTPERRVIEVNGIEDERYLVGIRVAQNMLPGAVTRERVRNPLLALPRAVAMTADITLLFFEGVRRIVSGEISRRQVGGPIEIARQSGLALAAGWGQFLNLLILLSINLAILNLLPIPVLDGGQAAMFLLEGVRGRELSTRSRERFQFAGLVMVLALMGLAFWNDFARYGARALEWLGG